MSKKDDFLEFVDRRLRDIGFVKIPEENHWVCDHDVRVGGSIMIVNGQRINNPGEVRHISFNIEEVGEGNMKDVESGEDEGFVEFDFYMIENDKRQDLTPTMCIYFDDEDEFDAIVNNILRG